MKIIVMGIGAIGSNLVSLLAPDLKGEHEIVVLDKDVVEERNVQAGTQFYLPDQIGLSKGEALQFNIYNHFQKEIDFIYEPLKNFATSSADLNGYNLIIDCFDNTEARKKIQNLYRATTWDIELLHIGFSANFTFAIEWDKNYKVPTDIEGLDICEMPGAAAFVKRTASLGAMVVEEYIQNKTKIEIVGGKFSHRVIK